MKISPAIGTLPLHPTGPSQVTCDAHRERAWLASVLITAKGVLGSLSAVTHGWSGEQPPATSGSDRPGLWPARNGFRAWHPQAIYRVLMDRLGRREESESEGQQGAAHALPVGAGDQPSIDPELSPKGPGVGPGSGAGKSRPSRPRRVVLPIGLFLLTCLSTFFTGACQWWPPQYLFLERPLGNFDSPWRRAIYAHWDDGLTYMACVLAILLTHEMGHFIATLCYRVPASLPFFIPLPISPIGTMGAVIAMDGRRANRRATFDIGLAGPLAGLVVAFPILIIGVMQLDFTARPAGFFQVDLPLATRMILDWLQPIGYTQGAALWQSQLNPYFMAGWIGLFITGLNMMPVSQLDGGHVIYTLFGRWSHWIARAFVLLAILSILLGWVNNGLWLMVVVVMLFGTDHPPTHDDRVPLGWFRTILGCLSLAIPVLCFAPQLFIVPE
jgi:Zn-dependent protease